VAITAFSGIAMANPVAATTMDSGSKIVTHNDVRNYYSWSLTYYTKNHCEYNFNDVTKMYIKNKWVTVYTVNMGVSFKKLSPHNLQMHLTEKINGKLKDSEYKNKSTTLSAYGYYNTKKAGLKSTTLAAIN
jgi:hypothetical protein